MPSRLTTTQPHLAAIYLVVLLLSNLSVLISARFSVTLPLLLLVCCGLGYTGVSADRLKLLGWMILPSLLIINLLHYTEHTLSMGILISAQILFIVTAAQLLLNLTTETTLVDGFIRLVHPLRIIGVNPRTLGLSLLLTLRFTQIIRQRYRLIYEAQRARGLERRKLAILMPLLITTFQTAEQVGEALLARGYETTPTNSEVFK